jgi:hypothetical protein
MKKNDIEPRNYKEHVLICHSRVLGEDDETIAERLKTYRFVQLVTGIIAGVSLFGLSLLFGFILYQLLFVG